MKIKLATVVNKIVETLLPTFTADKLLHLRIDAHYLYFPHAFKNGNNCSDSFEQTIFVHFIFYRPTGCTKVLLLKSDRPIIEDDDIFEMVSNHDSCWRSDGVESNLSSINWEMIAKIEKHCHDLKVECSPNLRLNQPNFSDIHTIKLIDGRIEGVDYDCRQCKMIKADKMFIFKN